MTDVAIVTNIPTPYREGLFGRLANQDGVDLTVYYCAESFPWRNWSIEIGDYNARFLPGINYGQFVFNSSIVREICRNDYDCLIVGGYSTPTAVLSELTGAVSDTSLVMWVESHLWDERNRNASIPKRLFKRLFVGSMLGLCNAYVVPGKASEAYVVHYGASSDAVFRAPTTCDVAWFDEQSRLDSDKRAALRDRWNITEDQLLLYVGRIAEKKGIETLLQAFDRLQSDVDDVGLLMVGTGPRKEQLADTYDGNGIYWLGYQPDERLPKIYGLADLFVCPSLGDQWAVVVNEAMACRLPVVATNTVGAAHDLIEDGTNGWMIDSGSVPALSEVLSEAFVPPTDVNLAEMGNESWRIINQYTHEDTVDGFLAVVDYVT